jgi:hypothetical protein
MEDSAMGDIHTFWLQVQVPQMLSAQGAAKVQAKYTH